MVKRHILTAAVLSLGGLGLATSPVWGQAATDTQAQQQQQPAAATGQQAKPADQTSAQTAANEQGAQASETDARQALSQLANAVLSKNSLQSITQQISEKSQKNLGDLSQQSDQSAKIDQAVDQLKQAYKDKFNQDLDLSQNSDQIFTAQFFQVGGLGDQARQAAERQSPDAAGSSGAAKDDKSSAAGNTPAANADQAQTAGDTMKQRTMVTIPASHDLPAARIALVKDGGQWKVALPHDTDAKQLSTKIQEQLQQAVQQKDKWGSDAAQAQQAIVHQVLIAFAHNSPGDSGGDKSSPNNSNAVPH